MNTNLLSHAREFEVSEQNFSITGSNVNLKLHHSSSGTPLKELQAQIPVEALLDSAERCDAPKCDPETRVAVQDNIYSWIVYSDEDHPRETKWLTGPAGSRETTISIMGPITERCKEQGVLVVSFFSSTGLPNRRTKTAFVTTMAYQPAHHSKDLKNTISTAIQADPIVFEKNPSTQMKAPVLAPFESSQLVAMHGCGDSLC